MEVTTVSPRPASPTEGDDLCERDVTTVAIHSVTLLICLCGVAGNGAVISLLSLKTYNSGIFKLAVADFLFLLLTVLSALLFLMEDMSCSPVMPMLYLRFLFQLSLPSALKRCRSLLCPPGIFCHLPQDLMGGGQCPALGPFHHCHRYHRTAISVVNSLCQSQEHKHCKGALISLYILNFLIFAPSMVISSTILFIHFKGSSQQQQSQKLDIIVFLAVLLTLPLSLWNFLQQLGYPTVSPQVVLLFACMHSSINPFIYISVTKCWRRCSTESLRECLQKVFEEPEGSSAPSNDATRDTGV
uniref:G-protein coupled receptors family 1 profile domain-containing protein n=1 Tax=Serinus canaria TaxID=9135 RepID=A0A8C9N5H6_SERCA